MKENSESKIILNENLEKKLAPIATNSVQSAEGIAMIFSKEFLNETRALFEPIAGKSLSDDECSEIANSMIELELLLKEIK